MRVSPLKSFHALSLNALTTGLHLVQGVVSEASTQIACSQLP